MHLACQGGSLNVARWLYVAGAGEDVHALSNDGDSCMLLAVRELPSRRCLSCRVMSYACMSRVCRCSTDGESCMLFARGGWGGQAAAAA